MEISLTAREFELVATFFRQPGMVFTRDKLLEAIWGMISWEAQGQLTYRFPG